MNWLCYGRLRRKGLLLVQNYYNDDFLMTELASVESYACSRILRVSPLDLRSSPSVCLMKHILSDKLVTLITPEQGSYQEGKMAKAGKLKEQF